MPREAIAHLDCKGLPLTPDYLCDFLLPLLKKRGATGILLEWEDMLPFVGNLAVVAAPHAFTKDEVARVLARASSLGLEVIPLVQTIGHLEYVLKHATFAHLREDPLDFGTLSPADPAAQALVRELVAQVLALHPSCTKLHIGCDEPTLGVSDLSRAAADGLSGLLVDHVQRTAAAASDLGGRRIKTVLLWHDACVGMRDVCLQRLLRTREASIGLAVWTYTPSLPEPTTTFLRRLGEAGSVPLYAASSFKGAEQCDAIVPDGPVRSANQRAWHTFATGSGIPLAGIILTGWSRFGHSMPLCEMWPAGVPALLRALAFWSHHRGQLATASVVRDRSESDADTWIAEWRSEATVAPQLHALCISLDAARTQLAAVATERQQFSAAARAGRAQSPRAALSLQDRAAALRDEIARLDSLARTLLLPQQAQQPSIFRGRADADEWVDAVIGDMARRCTRLAADLRGDVDAAMRRSCTEAPCVGGWRQAGMVGLAVASLAGLAMARRVT